MITNQRPQYVYGEILSHSLYTAVQTKLSGAGRFLSQGIAVGALIAFVFPVVGMLSNPDNGYNLLFMGMLPLFLIGGSVFGAFEGIVIWACSYVTGHNLNVGLRTLLGIVVLIPLIAAFTYLFADASPYADPDASYLSAFGPHIIYGFIFGLVIGSRFQPWYELVRGSTAPPWRSVLTGITGLALRLVILYSLMESVLFLIYSQQGDFGDREITMATIAVGHFVAAAVIVLTRMPFWLLLPLAVIINFPIVAFITDVLTENNGAVRSISISYLALWAFFLLSRVHLPDAAVAFIKEELRYYLID